MPAYQEDRGREGKHDIIVRVVRTVRIVRIVRIVRNRSNILLRRSDALEAPGRVPPSRPTAGAAAAAGAASAVLGGAAAAQERAPAILTNTQAGRTFRAFVKFSQAPPSVVDVRARALTAREVVVRTEAAQTCYTSVREVLRPSALAPAQAQILGHGGVGIVEAVGPQAIRTRVGDRVVVTFHAACGSCHNCLWMRSDQCVNRGGATAVPTCEMTDGTPIPFSNNSGMSELMIVHEEHVVPVFTEVSAVELAMLPCVGGAGLGMATTNVPVQLASDVVIFGAGPVGLSALQGAKLKGASRLIVVEPIAYRRALALTLGATDVLDPNQFRRTPRARPARGWARDDYRYDDTLLDRIREMCRQPTDRFFAGGGRNGPDHVIEAAGGDQMPPKEAAGPDPTGITTLMQSWELCSRIGTCVSCTVGQPEDAFVQIPGSQFGDSAKHHWAATGGGTNDRRDVPRYARLMETGQLDMKALASKTFPLHQTREAYQECADRTVVATLVTPNA
jgi:S-(hydroxymethyl)glutathione dehydrogenase/alcohol dehydrogenase